MLYSAHLDTGNDMKRLLALLVAVCVSQCAIAGIREGVAAYNSGRYDIALDEFLAAANQGSAEAQVSLAVMFENGQGVLRDYEKALTWYRKAADQGHFGAQNNLGLMYAAGRGYRRIRGKRWSGTPRPRIRLRAGAEQSRRSLRQRCPRHEGLRQGARMGSQGGGPGIRAGTHRPGIDVREWPRGAEKSCGCVHVLHHRRGGRV